VLDQLPAPVIGLDPDGIVAFINREAEVLLPDAGQMLGRPMQDFLPVGTCGAAGIAEIGGITFQILTRTLRGKADERGKLLLLMPQQQAGSH
jgi:nitrogen fixation/metabolism regulation signal transduction histidine kinase